MNEKRVGRKPHLTAFIVCHRVDRKSGNDADLINLTWSMYPRPSLAGYQLYLSMTEVDAQIDLELRVFADEKLQAKSTYAVREESPLHPVMVVADLGGVVIRERASEIVLELWCGDELLDMRRFRALYKDQQ